MNSHSHRDLEGRLGYGEGRGGEGVGRGSGRRSRELLAGDRRIVEVTSPESGRTETVRPESEGRRGNEQGFGV